MNMKWILLPALCLLAASCEEEIEIFVGNGTPVLLMNAQLRSDDTLHTVVLNTSWISGLEPYDGAEVTVTVNGTERIVAEPVFQEEYYVHSLYRFRADFKPGDVVRIDAVRGTDHASAEVVFPKPAEIVSVDMTRDAVTDPYDVTFFFRAGIRDVPGEDTFFRLAMDADVEIHSFYKDGSGERERVWWDRFTNRRMVDASEDPVLNDGRTAASENELFGDILPGNTYWAFSDQHFRDDAYTLRFKSYRTFFKPERTDVAADVERCYCDAVVKLYTMSFAQYRYLKAIDNFETFGYEMSVLVEPTTLPSNVEGGLGFVSAETCVTRSIRVDEYARSNLYTKDDPGYSSLTSEE